MEPESRVETPVAATTADAPAKPDGDVELPKSAESAPAVKDADEPVTQGVRSRIDELTRYRREAERERDYWRSLAEKARETPKVEPEVEKPKSLEDFGYDEAKFNAHTLSLVEKRSVEAAKRAIAEERAREAEEASFSDFLDRANDFAKTVPDYYEVTGNEDLPFTRGSALLQTMVDAELGPQIAYHLAKNPRLAHDIARLPPLQQAREIGRIEAKLSEKPTVPKVSEAPPPAAKLDASNPVVEKDPKDWTDTEFLKWRRKYMK